MTIEATKESEDQSGNSTLLYGGGPRAVPLEAAECPECGGQLYAESDQWVEESGIPISGSLDLHCADDPNCEHRHWQSDWQPVIDLVEKWAGCEPI